MLPVLRPVPTVTAPGFDVIGDVHGCADELTALMAVLGYGHTSTGWAHPGHRRLAFVGDLVGHGPQSVRAARLVAQLAAAGHVVVRGNYDHWVGATLRGDAHPAAAYPPVAACVDQFRAACTPSELEALGTWMAELPLVAHLDAPGAPRLVMRHAGTPWSTSPLVSADAALQAHCLFGVADAALIRAYPTDIPPYTLAWVQTWTHSEDRAVRGHTARQAVRWMGHTINVDSGAYLGGYLTALQWPEDRRVGVAARHHYVTTNGRLRPLEDTSLATAAP